MEQLPDDLLADVLGRLPPSSLAASRCVRKHWCALIDARGLLRAHLRLEALYCTSLDCIARATYLFARPAPAARRIPGGCLDFGSRLHRFCYDQEVTDHCNGLLLLGDGYMVVNPATRQWATLPADPPEPYIGDVLGGLSFWAAGAGTENDDRQYLLDTTAYLVYDPMAESESQQHFEVFLVPFLWARVLASNREDITIDLDDQEWPPSTLRIQVFSSRRWRWEERSWVLQGEPAATMADILQSDDSREYKAVYFQGALYVHCQNDSVMRIAMSNDKYQMVTSPATRSELGAGDDATFYLGKSEKGVYFTLLDSSSCPQFRVWWLKEEQQITDDGNHIIHMEWVLKTNISLLPLLAADKLALLHRSGGFADDEWRLIHNYNNKEEQVPPVAAAHGHGDDKFTVDDEWDFDNADIVVGEAKDNKATAEADEHYPVFLKRKHYPVDEFFLGFHPYKEIVFFSLRSGTISYNLNTAKIQRLGGHISIPVAGMRSCFPYTPCWLTLGELSENS